MSLDKRCLLLVLMVGLQQLATATPAFPGAEGAGAHALGGRGGDVYHVTSLADAGPGTLRDGISTATGPRSILFRVSGNIELNSPLSVNKSRITIAGQTAPGDGICLQDYSLNIAANEIVVRHLRSRLGTNKLAEADAIWINSGTNIIVDHCSTSWSVDETFSITRTVTNFTMQWCYITESLNNSIHVKGAHGYGSILSSDFSSTYSVHHNLYAHHNSRSPRPGSGLGSLFRLDFRNNVIYNWGGRAGYSAGTNEFLEMNYVGNYLVAGLDKRYNYAFACGAALTDVYQQGNRLDLTLNGLVDGLDSGWGMFSGTYVQETTPFPVPTVTTEDAVVAYQRVLAQGGAMPWRRDPVDARVVNSVRTLTGRIIDDATEVGGWPVLASETAPLDTDNDGMPDYWEGALGWDTNNAADRNVIDPSGYTRLETYLNWLADPHALCAKNGHADVDLRVVNGGATNLTFTVANGTNGVVTLLGNGHTARFLPMTNHQGLANFVYYGQDPLNGVGFGPVSVGVLVTSGDVLIPPAVALTAPPQGAVLAAGSEVLLSAEVVAGSGVVTNVRFYAGQSEPLTLVGEAGTAPYTQSWLPPLVSGTYTLRAVGADDAGLSGTSSIQVAVTLPQASISTAYGDGSDVEMGEQNTPAARNAVTLNTRFNGNDRNEVVGLRFDLGGYEPSSIDNVVLNLINYRTNLARVVDLYGVTPGAFGGGGVFSTETWSDSAVTNWGDLPGLLESDLEVGTASLDLANLTLLVEGMTITRRDEGAVEQVQSPALSHFVRDHGDSGLVTLLVAAGNLSSGQFRFCSRETTSSETGVLSGAAGSFAPFLTFTARPRLLYTLEADGERVELQWVDPGYRLQSQTNASSVGLTSDWADYPGGESSPVSIPVVLGNSAVFFRLTR